MRSTAWAAVLALLLCGAVGAQAADYAGPARVRHSAGPRAAIGQCLRTRVLDIVAQPGSPAPAAIRYRDGVIQAYDADLLGHTETRPGDPIQLCLVSFTRDCDDTFLPGRTYATGNLRTGAAWTLPDIRSSCQGR